MQLQTRDPFYSVSSLTREIKQLLESGFGEIRIRGEVSNLRVQQSGHVYFSLKDAGAAISCVCFRNDAARLSVRLRDGLQICASGRISLYEPRGNYQLVLRLIEADGVGRLQLAYEELKAKLLAEGLFDSSRKQALPALPQRIAFVTSESGAALQDFISVLQRNRWGGTLIVVPARVQGKEAAAEIVAGIRAVNKQQCAELLVVGRGGGSLEDLWPFNEEAVARAVAASTIPVISAVGHETDTTLCDFAADHRAETPTAAAEWICRQRERMVNRLDTAKTQLSQRVAQRMDRYRYRTDIARAHLRRHHPQQRIEQAHLRIDDLQSRLNNVLQARLQASQHAFGLIRGRINSLRPEQLIAHQRATLQQVALRLRSASHHSVLHRGFAVLRDPQSGKIIDNPIALPAGAHIQIQVNQGSFDATKNPAARSATAPHQPAQL